MTGISGVETTVALRRLGCTTPIIGLTGSTTLKTYFYILTNNSVAFLKFCFSGDDSPECREQFLRGAAQQVLTKPLRLQVCVFVNSELV